MSAIEHTFYQDTFDFTSHFPGNVTRKEGDMLVFSTRVPADVLNGVLGPQLDHSTMSARISETMAYFRKERIPMTWFIGPSSDPEGLESALAEQGMVPGAPVPGMAADLGSVSMTELLPGTRVVEVTDTATMKICSRTAANGFQLPPEAAEGYMNFVESYGFGPNRRWFLGYLDDVAASVALVVFHDSVAAIYCVATLPEQRGRGLGKAVTNAAMMAAKDAGYKIAVLEASEMGQPVYKKLGFEELCQIRTMTWHP